MSEIKAPSWLGVEKYKRDIIELVETSLARRRRAPIYSLIMFSILLWGSKAFTWLFPQVTLNVGDIHVHHFVYGVILIIISGFLAIYTEEILLIGITGVIFGAGLGLIADEFLLMITLDFDTYFAPIPQLVSTLIGIVVTIVYIIIIITLIFRTRDEVDLCRELKARKEKEGMCTQTL
jgi:hypothetical protein